MALKNVPKKSLVLYCILDRSVLSEKAALELAHRSLKYKCDFIQLRAKNMPSYELIALSKKIARLARRKNKFFVLNDRPDVALASNAAGVHRGKGDFSASSIRALLGKNAIVGETAHSLRETKDAESGRPRYIGAGPVFQTPFKNKLKPCGPDFIKRISSSTKIPVFTIGGIRANNLKFLDDTGASGICVSRAVKDVDRISKRIKK